MPRTATVHAVTAIGIDMGKNTLHMVGLDTRGTIVLREKVSRGRITSRLANLPPCLIGIEAGMATHYVARELAVLGHDVKQVPPAYSKPLKRGNGYLRTLFMQAARVILLRPASWPKHGFGVWRAPSG